jgi:hypothetical protein
VHVPHNTHCLQSGEQACINIMCSPHCALCARFDPNTGDVRTHVDPETQLEVPYAPQVRGQHTPQTWQQPLGRLNVQQLQSA